MKLRSMIVFVLIAAVILVGAWGVFCGAPMGVETFAPMEVMQRGADLEGEAAIFLDTAPAEGQEVTAEQLTDIQGILEKRLAAMGYAFSEVVQLGDGQFQVNIPVNDSTAFHDAQQLSDALAQTGRLYITDAANDDAVLLDRDSIAEVELQTNSLGKYSIFLRMTEAGKTLLEQVTGEVSSREREDEKYLHVFLDGKELAELSLREAATDGIFGFSSSYTEYEATRFQQIVNAGMLPVSLEANAQVAASARMGEHAWNGLLKALGIGAAVAAVVLLVVYRAAGLAHALSIAAYLALTAIGFALLGIPVTAANAAAWVLSLAFLVSALVWNSTCFRRQHLAGKNLRAAFRSGYAEASGKYTNAFVLLFLGFVVLIASGSAAIENLAYGYGLSLLTAYLAAAVVDRMLAALLVRAQDGKAGWYFPLGKANEGGNA